jgi:SAM-dependent methyltransferase
MRDDEYLAEEEGRRATANRLLDLVAAHRPRGRLLDVGCGHGLLIDEARRRGYEAEGLDLSARAVAYARQRLELPVSEIALEDIGNEQDGRWDAVVMADVLEHLADPAAALVRCHELLAPGGALLVVTPDPSSLAARVTGPRWWGYLPAHTILLPRAILRELVAATGLAIVRDVAFVRSFTLGYWMAGLAERGRPLAALAGAARRLPPSVRLSLSLGDERVVVARRPAVHAALEALDGGAEGAGTRRRAAAEPAR